MLILWKSTRSLIFRDFFNGCILIIYPTELKRLLDRCFYGFSKYYLETLFILSRPTNQSFRQNQLSKIMQPGRTPSCRISRISAFSPVTLFSMGVLIEEKLNNTWQWRHRCFLRATNSDEKRYSSLYSSTRGACQELLEKTCHSTSWMFYESQEDLNYFR